MLALGRGAFGSAGLDRPGDRSCCYEVGDEVSALCEAWEAPSIGEQRRARHADVTRCVVLDLMAGGRRGCRGG